MSTLCFAQACEARPSSFDVEGSYATPGDKSQGAEGAQDTEVALVHALKLLKMLKYAKWLKPLLQDQRALSGLLMVFFDDSYDQRRLALLERLSKEWECKDACSEALDYLYRECAKPKYEWSDLQILGFYNKYRQDASLVQTEEERKKLNDKHCNEASRRARHLATCGQVGTEYAAFCGIAHEREQYNAGKVFGYDRLEKAAELVLGARLRPEPEHMGELPPDLRPHYNDFIDRYCPHLDGHSFGPSKYYDKLEQKCLEPGLTAFAQ